MSNKESTAKKEPKKPMSLATIMEKIEILEKYAPKEPVPRRYKTNDTTVEKLGEILRDNPAGIMVLRDELVGLLASWEKSGHEGDRTFYLEGWNGNSSFDTDRIGRGSIFIPNLCVSIFGGMQPDKLRGLLELIADALANDGMLQRFQLLVFPDPCKWEYRDTIPDKDARDKVYAIFDKIADFDPVAWGAQPADDFNKIPYFNFATDAQKIFIAWQTQLHTEIIPAEDNQLIAQHLTKYDKLFPALALIFHILECAATANSGAVFKKSALLAAAWCDYLESHARRGYGLLADDGLCAAQHLAEKIKNGKLKNGFTARDIHRNQWSRLTSNEAVQAALDWLEDEHWVKASPVASTEQGGRKTIAYRINPKILCSGVCSGAANAD